MHTVLTDTQRDRHAYTTLLKLLTHNLYGGTASHRMNTCMYNRKLVVNLNQKLMKLICCQIIVASYLSSLCSVYHIWRISVYNAWLLYKDSVALWPVSRIRDKRLTVKTEHTVWINRFLWVPVQTFCQLQVSLAGCPPGNCTNLYIPNI